MSGLNLTTESNFATMVPDNTSYLDDNGTAPPGGGYPQMMINPIVFEIYNIYLYVMICFGVPMNMMVLVVFVRHRPTTTTDWFIVFITICDFISFTVNVPVYVTFTNGFWQRYGTTFLCRFHMFISQTLVLSSSFLIGGLALDRYLKVCKQSRALSKVKVRNICIFTMMVTSLLSVPCFKMFENKLGRCVVVLDKELFAYYFFVFLTFVFAVVTVVFSYVNVTQTVTKSEGNVKRHFGFRNRNQIRPSSPHKSSGLFKDSLNTPHVVERRTDNYNSASDADQTKQSTVISVIANESASGKNLTVEPRQDKRPPQPIQTRQMINSSNRTTKIAFWVCTVFILSWIPPWVSFFLAAVTSLRMNVYVVQFIIYGRMTYLVNGVANPILYTWLNRKFRGYIMETFCFWKS